MASVHNLQFFSNIGRAFSRGCVVFIGQQRFLTLRYRYHDKYDQGPEINNYFSR